jgi:polysaccharide biosynthesis transport protein
LNQQYHVGTTLGSPLQPHMRADSQTALGVQEETSFSLSQAIAFLRRQWPVLAISVLSALVLAVVYLFVTTPRYTATVVLMLDTRRLQLLHQQSVMSELSLDAPAVDSQLEVLKSEAVALQVINKLGLVDDPEFTSKSAGMLDPVKEFVKGWIGPSDEDVVSPEIQDGPTRQAVKYFNNGLTVRRLGRSYIIEISFQSPDRDKASRIANAIGEAYIQDQLQLKYNATKRATDWLQDRIAELRQQAEKADHATLEFRNKNNLTSTGGKLLSEQQLSEVSTQLVSAKAQTAEAKARLDRILEISKRGIGDAAVGDSLQNTVLNRLQQQYIEAAKREADFSSRYGSEHLAAVGLRREMRQIQEASKAETNRIAESYRSEYEIARSREVALQASLDQLTLNSSDTRAAQVDLRVLESSANAYRTLYDNFLQRYVEATQQQSLPDTEARVITEAHAVKTHPSVPLVLALAGFLGAAFGGAIAFARDSLDRVFRTTHQVEQVLGVECLGVIPAVADPTLHGDVLEDYRPPSAPRTITADLGLARQVVLAPFSRFTETIRSIKVAADTSTAARHIKVIGLVSALPGEGKSTVSSNLAQLVAHSGRQTLLIDADLRNPSLSRRIAPHAEYGMLEVIIGTAQLSDAVWRDPITGLDFLPTVLNTPIAHTSEVLASERMAELLSKARERYEYIIVDFPPLAPVVDAKAAARHVDAFVFVIEWGQTSPDVIFEALSSAEVVHSKLLGAVLNMANTSKLEKLESYKGSKYHTYYAS